LPKIVNTINTANGIAAIAMFSDKFGSGLVPIDSDVETKRGLV